MENPIYLGEGVYALKEYGSIVLKANDHLNPTDTIVLEQSVMENLIKFYKETL